MRVVLVCPYSLSTPGGVQGQVLGLAHSLRRRGVDARVLGPCDGPPPEPGIVGVGRSKEVESNGSMAAIAPGPMVARRTRDALSDLDPDVVHLHEPFVPGPTLSTMLESRVPMVGTFHASGDTSRAYELFEPMIRKAGRRLAARTAVSEPARRTAELHVGGSFLVLPNGVELGPFEEATPWPAERPAVCFVGRHEPRKGLGVLLAAYDGLQDVADLWVMGEGPETAALVAGAPPGVQWLGRVSDGDRARRLRGASVFCAPSVSGESFGIVLVEAMAAAVPVIASDIDGYRNVARADVEALLVPPYDPAALRGAIRSVLGDPALAARLVTAGARRAAEFSMDRLAGRFLEIYESVRAPARAR